MLEYKVVETSIVTDDAIEDIINVWVGAGWEFERMQFAMHEGSKRPGMAFIFFVRRDATGSAREKA
ncbi:MAG: DUF4177 domain-containing protein [Desulfuromonadaceae bacterium]|jgi:hypothetical protein